MAGIKGRNTKPEMIVRRGLHALGFRFRLHRRDLPGNPDVVLPRYRAAVFVHGCFWHGHDCALFKWPKTEEAFWREKITGNRERDTAVRVELRSRGWRVLDIWECSIRGRGKLGIEGMLEAATDWIRSGDAEGEVRGR